MNLQEFEHELRTNSAVRDPIERKWDLHELAVRLGLTGYSKMPKDILIDNIISAEFQRRLITKEKKEKKEKSNEDDEA